MEIHPSRNQKWNSLIYILVWNHRYRKAKIDCLRFVYVPATSAAHNRLLFFFFLLRPFTVLMKKTRAIKQSIFLRCLCVEPRVDLLKLFWRKLTTYSIL